MPDYQSLSDDDLFLMLSNHDHKAYTEIYNRYSAALYAHAYMRIRNREEAKDLIHELFAALWSKRDQIILKTGLSFYLYKAVRNRVIDLVIRQKRAVIYQEYLEQSATEATNITDHALRQKELNLIIEKEIDALPDKMKQVFNLSRKSHLSHKEISAELDISEFTVRKQISNALKVLKPRLSRLMSLFL